MLLSGNLTILGTRDARAWKPATLNVIKSTRLNLLLEKVELINACHFFTVLTSQVALSVLGMNQCLHLFRSLITEFGKDIAEEIQYTAPIDHLN